MPEPMLRGCSLLLERTPCSFASVQIGDNAFEGPNNCLFDVEYEWYEGRGSDSLSMREWKDVVLPKKDDWRRDGFVKPNEGVEDDCEGGKGAITASVSSESESFSSTRSESGTITLTRRLEGTTVLTEWADSANEAGRVALGRPAPGLIVMWLAIVESLLRQSSLVGESLGRCTLRLGSTCWIGEGSSDRVGVCGDSCCRMNCTAAEIPGLLMISGALSSAEVSGFVHSCGDDKDGGGGERSGVD